MKRLPLMEKKNQCFLGFQEDKAILSFPLIIIFIFKRKTKKTIFIRILKRKRIFPSPSVFTTVTFLKNRILS